MSYQGRFEQFWSRCAGKYITRSTTQLRRSSPSVIPVRGLLCWLIDYLPRKLEISCLTKVGVMACGPFPRVLLRPAQDEWVGSSSRGFTKDRRE